MSNESSNSDFLKQRELTHESGIYAIVFEGYIVYIGMSSDMKKRGNKHDHESNTGNKRKKYRILHELAVNDNNLQFLLLKKCEQPEMGILEKKLICFLNPMLNIIGQHKYSKDLSVEDFKKNLKNDIWEFKEDNYKLWTLIEDLKSGKICDCI